MEKQKVERINALAHASKERELTPEEKAEQRALLQYFRPENHDKVRAALRKAGRADLIGSGKGCLVPSDRRTPLFEQGRRKGAGGASRKQGNAPRRPAEKPKKGRK